MVSAGRYELPQLARNRIFLNGYMECSPVSLALKRNSGSGHQVLVDGEGIVVITLETLYISAHEPGGYTLPPDTNSWTATTCCSRVRPFHDAAETALREIRNSPDSAVPIHSYDSWASSALHWMQRTPIRPARDAICGYRLATAAEAFSDLDGVFEGLANLGSQTLRIIDLNPLHVRRAAHIEARAKTAIRCYKSLNVLPLRSVEADGSLESCERVIVTKSAPTTDPSVFEREPEGYATEAPHILLSRRIPINPSGTSFVCQMSHEALLLTQVSRSVGKYVYAGRPPFS